MRKVIQVENETQWKSKTQRNTLQRKRLSPEFLRWTKSDRAWRWWWLEGRERPHIVMYNMCMYCEWEATYLSPIDKIPDNPTCPHKRRKARYLLEKSYKTMKQSANKPMTIRFQMNVKWNSWKFLFSVCSYKFCCKHCKLINSEAFDGHLTWNYILTSAFIILTISTIITSEILNDTWHQNWIHCVSKIYQ